MPIISIATNMMVKGAFPELLCSKHFMSYINFIVIAWLIYNRDFIFIRTFINLYMYVHNYIYKNNTIALIINRNSLINLE